MTKNAAIQSFFESFGLPAFPATSVPTSGDEMPEYPYLTYTVNGDQEMGRSGAVASLYYRTESWTGINAKVDEISRFVGSRVTLPCDGGGIIVRKGSPWSQPMGEDSDNMVKKRVLMFEFLFVTTY